MSIAAGAPDPVIMLIADSVVHAHVARGYVDGVRPIVFRTVSHTYRKLAALRDRVMAEIAHDDAVVFVDLDEVRNAVVVGVDPAAVQRVQDAGRKLAEGIGMEGAFIAIPSGAYVKQQTLVDLQRPLRGGFQFGYPTPKGLSACTMGYPATWDIGILPVMVSAAHCSYSEANLDDPSHLLTQPAGTNFIGYEYATAPLLQCTMNGNPMDCHYGDVSVFFIDSVYGVSVDVHVLGRTTGDGSTTIDSSNPTWDIIGEIAHSTVGLEMHRMGVITGESQTHVTATCVNFVGGTDVASLCMDEGGGHSQSGDSGGPYFKKYDIVNSQVLMAGIHSGGRYDGWSLAWRVVFTPMNIIRYVFPDLEPLAQ